MFFGLFLVVRGAPAMLLYRGVLGARDRAALAFYSATELPLVVAITTIAIETGHMKTSTAAGLVGAAMLSTLVFPFVGLALRKGSAAAGARRGGRRRPRLSTLRRRMIRRSRARSSVGERSPHTREVAGSKPAAPIARMATSVGCTDQSTAGRIVETEIGRIDDVNLLGGE